MSGGNVLSGLGEEPETGAYWRGVAEGKLLVRFCQDCGEPHHYPRGHCPYCFSIRLEDRPAAGTGEIYSYSVVRAGPAAPYVLAYVTLDEGVTMLSQVVDCDPGEVAIGDRVELGFAELATSHATSVPIWRRK